MNTPEIAPGTLPLDLPKCERPQSPPSAPDPQPSRRRRRGKIARLPAPIREQINLMLEQGLSYRVIIEKLDALRLAEEFPNVPPITA